MTYPASQPAETYCMVRRSGGTMAKKTVAKNSSSPSNALLSMHSRLSARTAFRARDEGYTKMLLKPQLAAAGRG